MTSRGTDPASPAAPVLTSPPPLESGEYEAPEALGALVLSALPEALRGGAVVGRAAGMLVLRFRDEAGLPHSLEARPLSGPAFVRGELIGFAHGPTPPGVEMFAFGERYRAILLALRDREAELMPWIVANQGDLAGPGSTRDDDGAHDGGPAGAVGTSRGPHGDWRARVRHELIGRPHALRLDQLLPAGEIPSYGCMLPWVRLEISPSAMFAPCCIDYPARHHLVDLEHSTIPAIWNGDAMRAFRRAMLHGGQPETCRETCVTLISGRERAQHLSILGGPEAFVESQIRRVEDVLAGREEARSGPLEFIFSPTTYCNYDCLMCAYGETGTLGDELQRPFYDALEPLLVDLRLIAASGGEPFASREFQAFLARLDPARYPQLRVAVTTNFSYLTPAVQERLSNVPWGGFTVSLNAATAATYELVNRGVTYERIRQNLDALYERRARGAFRGQVTYNFVVLRANVHEVEAIADLSFADGAEVSYLLPHYNRHDESVFVHEEAMTCAVAALERVGNKELARGREGVGREALARASVLRDRLERRIFAPIPSLTEHADDGPSVALKDLVLRARGS